MLTLFGEGANPAELKESVQRLATCATRVDLRDHVGVHPRIGSLDVVPFVALACDSRGRFRDGPIAAAVDARDDFMAWASAALGVPCFAYGPERQLPQVRRQAFSELAPDFGPAQPHQTAGACAVGARPILVAYNLWLAKGDVPGSDLELARSIAKEIRGVDLRALGMQVGDGAQVSCNLIAPFRTGPGTVYDQVARLAEQASSSIERAELVGLVPLAVLEAEPRGRIAELGLDEEHTIEAAVLNKGRASLSKRQGPHRLVRALKPMPE